MILVTGATGHVGRELIPQLLQAGQTVRALGRDAGRLAALPTGAERCVGDLNDPAALAVAIGDVSRIFLVTYDSQQDRNVLGAAKRAGVQRIVKLSTLEAAEHKIKVGVWHYEREDLIRASGLGWTFLRPGMFMTNAVDWWAASIRQQGAVFFPGGKGRVAPVDPRDVAAVGCRALTEPGHDNQAYELTGPELMTMAGMVEIIGKQLGRPLKYQDIPPLAARLWMLKSGMDRRLVDALMEMMTSLRRNEGAIVTDAVERVTGLKPRTFETWCREHIAEFQS